MSSSASQSEKSVSDNETQREGTDVGWLYADMIDGSKYKTQCKFCNKQIRGGGITRFKQHLAGGHRNVAICPKCPKKIREEMRANLEGKHMKDKERTERREALNEALFQRDYTAIEDSSDEDDLVYPPDIQSAAEKRAYRRAMKDSIRSEHERRELGQHRQGGSLRFELGSGSRAAGSHPQKKHKASHGPSLKKSSSLRDYYVPAKDPKQKTVKGMLLNARERVGKAFSKLFFVKGISANIAEGPFLQNAIDEAVQAGTGVKAPTPYEIMNKYLRMEKAEVGEYIDSLKTSWAEYGVTIMADGWTSYTRKQIINFLVYCDGKTVFLRSVDASDRVKDYKYIMKLLKGVVNEVGIENVVQIVTDNGSNFKKAGLTLMKDRACGIFWTPCAAHCIDLILKDFGKINSISRVVEQARELTTYIYNHGHLLALMRGSCGGDLLRPGITRFATNFIALHSIVDKKVGLKALFGSAEYYALRESSTSVGKKMEDLVGQTSFWDGCLRAMRIMEPVVAVLRMVDGDKKPTMGFIYDAMTKMREIVKEQAGSKSYRQFLKIIDDRWTNMLIHPLHKAAYYFNPKYQYKHSLGTRSELLSAVQEVVERLVRDRNTQTQCMNEIKYFREALLSFGRITAVNGRSNTLPAEWWILYGVDAPNLRKVAIKVLSQTASAGGCERNWSTFNLIHSKRRNKLGQEKLNDLVYVNYNTALQMKHALEGQNREDYTDPIDIAYIFKMREDSDEGEEDVLRRWMETNGQPLLDDEEGRPNATIAAQMGADVDEFLARSGRRSVTPIGVESDPDSPSHSHAFSGSGKSKDASDSGSGDAGAVGQTSGAHGGNEGQSASGGGGCGGGGRAQSQDRQRLEAGREYNDQHRNAHGEYIPSPEPMDWEYGYGQQNNPMDDLISSVGSLHIDDNTSGSTSHHGSQSDFQGSSYGFFPPYYPASGSTAPPFYASGYGYDQGVYPHHFSSEVPLPYAPQPLFPSESSESSTTVRTNAPRREAGVDQRRYPRLGMLQSVSDDEYRQIVMDYKTIYSYKTWEDYCEYIEACRRHNQHQRCTNMEQGRNSFWG